MGLAIVKADCFRFRCHPAINKDYLHGWLNSPQARQSFVERSHGIGRLRINLRDYRVTPVLLPPDAEQRRIVAKLDTFSARSKRAPPPPRWRLSRRGNPYVTTEGYHIVVFKRGVSWAFRIEQIDSEQALRCQTEDAARSDALLAVRQLGQAPLNSHD